MVAEALVKAVRQHVATLGEQTIRITASVGVALFGRPRLRRELLAYADQAMYEAKESGRDRMSRLPPGARPPPPHGRGSTRPSACAGRSPMTAWCCTPSRS